MKLTMMALAASGLLMTGSVVAQDQAVDDRLTNDSQKSVAKAELPATVSDARAFGTYRMMESLGTRPNVMYQAKITNTAEA